MKVEIGEDAQGLEIRLFNTNQDQVEDLTSEKRMTKVRGEAKTQDGVTMEIGKE